MQMMTQLPEIKIDWVPRRLRRGEKVALKLSLDIPAGYHIQANKPAEELMIPTKVSFGEAKGIAIGEPSYPAPSELPVSWSEVKILTYEGKIDIEVPIQVAADAKVGTCKVDGKLSYQACTASACLPPTTREFALKLEIV